MADLEKKPKLKVLREIVKGNFKEKFVDVGDKNHRKMLTKLRGGTAELREETGRWGEQPREERICTFCRN